MLPPAFLALKCAPSKIELHNTAVIHKDFKGVILCYPENNVRVKCDALFGWNPIFLKGHLASSFRQVKREIVPTVFSRDRTELRVTSHMMECTRDKPVSIYLQVISYQFGHLLPQ